MEKSFDGSCQCGGVRYRVVGAAAALFVCHCTECQRQSSSAFGMALWIRRATLSIQQGELKRWTRRTPSGRSMECSFCPDCGTRLFHVMLGQHEFLSIKPGTLEETSWLKPVAHIWTNSKQPWVEIDPQSLQYKENPSDFAELMAAWEAGGCCAS